jgi:menaquinone-dependent protoporphyrinogen IX oxidase
MVSSTILAAYASRIGSTVGMAEAIGKTLIESGAPSAGDHRDWNAIRAWATSLTAQL